MSMCAGQPERQGTTLSSRLRSGLLRPRTSTIEPVGHTSTQAPQNRQPASSSETPPSMPMRTPSSVRW